MSESAHLVLEVDLARGLVRATRTAARLTSDAEVLAMVESVRARLDLASRRRLAVLVDLRAAPLRDETDYASTMRRFRAEIIRGFRAAAFLVETRVGLMQVQRFAREEGLAAPAFQGEAEALAALGIPPRLA